MSDNINKYIYYTINPREQLFKQLSGFLYFLRKANISKKILVLPRFELNNKFYNYSELFDYGKINDNFNIITYDKYIYISASDPIIGENSEAYISGFWQFPFNTHNETTRNEYMYYRKHVSFHDKYFKLAPLRNESYLAVHWRQDDFLKIRPQVVLSKEDLVIYIKLKLKELNINSVYISTDSKNMNDIEYIRKNLPTFSYKDTFDDNMDYAILESIICTQSDYFIGTDTSLYSTYIMGERIKMGYTKDKQEIKLNKSNKL